jgi:hypothetical protein
MNGTATIPANPRSYDPSTAPASGTDQSRFSLPQTVAGWGASRAEGVISAWKLLVEDRKAEMQPLEPTTKKLTIKKLALVEGHYVLIDRCVIHRTPTHEGTTDGKFKKVNAAAGDLVDRLVLGEKELNDARDGHVYEAFAAAAEQEQPNGRTLRAWNDVMAEFIALRYGVQLSAAKELA